MKRVEHNDLLVLEKNVFVQVGTFWLRKETLGMEEIL